MDEGRRVRVLAVRLSRCSLGRAGTGQRLRPQESGPESLVRKTKTFGSSIPLFAINRAIRASRCGVGLKSKINAESNNVVRSPRSFEPTPAIRAGQGLVGKKLNKPLRIMKFG